MSTPGHLHTFAQCNLKRETTLACGQDAGKQINEKVKLVVTHYERTTALLWVAPSNRLYYLTMEDYRALLEIRAEIGNDGVDVVNAGYPIWGSFFNHISKTSALLSVQILLVSLLWGGRFPYGLHTSYF